MTLKQQETSLLLSGRAKKYSQGAVNPIIQRTSSVIFDSVAQKRDAINILRHSRRFLICAYKALLPAAS